MTRFRIATILFMACLYLAPGARAESAGDVALLKLDHSPHARLHAVPLTDVRLTGGFWSEQYRLAHEVSLRRLWELAADDDAGHVLTNFLVAAGLAEGEFAGTDWQDAWMYKWIEAASSFYAVTGDAWALARINAAIPLIEKAQQDDGYIATQITVTGRERFTDPRHHEVYSMGHLLTAACVHHRATGDDRLLNVATRCADFLCETLGKKISPGYAHNPSAVMGMVELYRETGEPRYLECAQTIVDGRGENPRQGGLWYREPGVLGTDLFQDRTPLRRSTEVVGHNVFFTYLYAGAADICLENGDRTLWDPLTRLWRDLTERKICINGGVSPMGHGISRGGDFVVEAVGAPYFLPCADCYNETCGQIGNLMWNYRMLCHHPEGKYADMMESELYNGFLGGISLSGDLWFYRNSLRRYDVEHDEVGHNNLAERVEPGRKRICCPTNLLRTIAQMPTYLYGVSDTGIYVLQYAESEVSTALPDGRRVALDVKTDYPWDGKVTITVKEAPAEKFAIFYRIPEWAKRATVTVAGLTVPRDGSGGRISGAARFWKAGDQLVLDLPMPGRLMAAHPKAEQLRNQVAVMRGPMLYCLESHDLDDDIDLNNILLPSDATFDAVRADEMPLGIRVLEGEALYRNEPSWDGQLYRPVAPEPMKYIPIRMIPYFAWANRGPSSMTTWMPVLWRE